MNKIFSLISFLLIISVSFISPLYAASHEKKAENVTTEETKKAEGEKKESSESKEATEEGSADKKEGDDDEEPECD